MVQFQVRFSIVTYNLWNTQRWPERADALGLFLDLYAPDVFCVQELVRETRDFVDERLTNHARIDGEAPGWLTESNIWWRRDLFEYVEHGAEEFGCTEYPDRRLFWVRLRPCDRSRSVVVSTVHLTDFATAHELETGDSPRVEESRQLVQALARVVADDEPALIVGDFNDSCGALVPLRMAGYVSCFGAFHQIPPHDLACELRPVRRRLLRDGVRARLGARERARTRGRGSEPARPRRRRRTVRSLAGARRVRDLTAPDAAGRRAVPVGCPP